LIPKMALFYIGVRQIRGDQIRNQMTLPEETNRC
jgi:hypothetical protein